jgi:endonuclease YncB( thermonuclease family)
MAAPLAALLLTSAGCAPPDPPAPAITANLTQVIDGDTIDVADFGRVRLIGIDTPEIDTCGYEQATDHLVELLAGKVVLVSHAPGLADTDQNGRLLRYVDLPDGDDAGLAQLEAGWARADNDSREGFPPHPREPAYRSADAAADDRGCYPD